MRSSLAGVALLSLAAAPSSFTLDELERLEQEKQGAEAQLAALEAASNTSRSDLDTLEQSLIAAAMESRRREEQASAAELKLIDLRTRLNTAEDALMADHVALEDLLGILASSGRRQPPALVVSPGRANDAIRRAILTGDAAPQLTERVDRLTVDIKAMNVLEQEIRGERARLAAAEAVLDLKQAEILALTSQKRAAFQSVAGEAKTLRTRVAALGKEASTLRSLLAALEESAPPMPTHKPRPRLQLAALSPAITNTATDAAPIGVPPPPLVPLGVQDLGNLAKPAAGLLKRTYGDRMPGGGRSQGLFIETRSGAQVAAPVDGRIDYAGQFRTYGNMLILRTSDGYHVILTGMGQLYAEPGDTVTAGEPIGQMPGRVSPPPELYMELRKEGEPLNPAKWMK
ncbi:MAG: peptidoglycan DD-metalloendopeptidase family protein [Pseudomonadota bacterium]